MNKITLYNILYMDNGYAHFVTPTILPGISRTSDLVHAINAACGPPYPSGVPSR